MICIDLYKFVLEVIISFSGHLNSPLMFTTVMTFLGLKVRLE